MLTLSPGGPSRRRALKAMVGVGVGTLTGLGARRFTAEALRLETVHAELPLRSLPRALDGLRVGMLTDLHRSATVSREHLERSVDLLNAAAPDLVLLGGDYVSYGDRAYVGSVADTLSRVAAPHGVFAVLGNHDEGVALPRALGDKGIAVLSDARTGLVVRGEALDIIGLRFWTRGTRPIEAIARGRRGFSILLAHDPRRLAEAAALDIPLLAAGHTHGGQVVVPMLGAPAARRFPVLSGMARRGGTLAYVSRGVGTVYVPIRVNCPPEVSVLTLRSSSSPIAPAA